MHGVVVNTNVFIGKNCIINTKTLIERDSIIFIYCHVSNSATTNWNVKIKSKCFIGSNSTIKEGITIKQNSFIKANILVK